MNDYYDLLGVSADAPTEEIEAAFRERVKETHPDVSDAPDADERFRAVKRAREVLTTTKERDRYDRLGHDEYVQTVGDGPWSFLGGDDEPGRSDQSASEGATGDRSGRSVNASRGGGTAAGNERTETADGNDPAETAARNDPAETGPSGDSRTTATSRTSTDAGSRPHADRNSETTARTAGSGGSTSKKTTESSTSTQTTESSSSTKTGNSSATGSSRGRNATTGSAADDRGRTPSDASKPSDRGRSTGAQTRESGPKRDSGTDSDSGPKRAADPGASDSGTGSESESESGDQRDETDSAETDSATDTSASTAAKTKPTADRTRSGSSRSSGSKQWTWGSTTGAFPDGPLTDPVANAAIRAGVVRAVGVIALLGLLIIAMTVGVLAGPLGDVRTTFWTVPTGPAATVVVAAVVFVGHHLRIRNRYPRRTNDAVVPTRRAMCWPAGLATFTAIGWFAIVEVGHLPSMLTTVPAVAVASLFVVAVGTRTTGIGRAVLASLPVGVAAGVVATTVASTPAVPASALPAGVPADAALVIGPSIAWGLVVTVPLAAIRTGLLAWNLRYRGGLRLAPAAWELALLAPVLVAGWAFLERSVGLDAGADVLTIDLLGLLPAVIALAPPVVALALAVRWGGSRLRG